MAVSVYDRMVTYDDRYPDPTDYYFEKLKQLRLVSPALDGTAQLVGIDPLQNILQKAELSTADAGAVNTIYSLGVFLQYITKANALGMLPKESWRRQGYRAVKTASKTGDLGIAEASAIAAADAVEPVYFEVAPSPKEIRLVSRYTQRLSVLAQIADAVTIDQNRQVIEKDFFRSLSNDLLVTVDTLQTNDFESLDRVASSTAEITDKGFAAGDEDIYGVDRSIESWADANVDGGTAGADRDLQTRFIDDLRADQEPYWESFDHKVFLANYKQHVKWSQLESAKQRFGVSDVSFTVGDGVRTMPGERGGFRIASWDGIPVIRDDSITTTGTAGGNIYLFDLDYLGISWGRPIEYLDEDNPFIVGHTVMGLWYGIGELYCTQFKAQGKVTDLTT